MAIFQIPVQDQRYADSGRRFVKIGNREVAAALSELKAEDRTFYGASHEIYIPKVPGINSGMEILFEDTRYRVVKIVDPKSADPTMRGRYYRLICNPAPLP